MPKAYFLYWSAIIVVAMAIMAGLYSRIVYTLWFKRHPENQLTFQMMVSINQQVQYGNSFLLINLRWGQERNLKYFLGGALVALFLVSRRPRQLRGKVALGTRTEMVLAHYVQV